MRRRNNKQSFKLRSKIIEAKTLQPWMSSRTIGHLLGCDHTWVLKVLHEASVSTRLAPKPKIPRKKKIRYGRCRYCSKRLEHGKSFRRRGVCSQECYDLAFFFFIECFFCKTIFKKKKSALGVLLRRGYKHFFCKYQCFMDAGRAKMIVRKKKMSIGERLATSGFTKSEERDIIQEMGR